ncbi:MAG: tetratricopeptide repeat protein [Acidobacteria bacterium]|nr:tetratricopeptide repeat protein [Acidobacteriota bacterium]
MTGLRMAVGLSVVALVTVTGCARRSASVWTPPAAGPSVFHRQVNNAVDAGDGDLQVRQWQRQMATQPDDLETRLQLARHFEALQMPDLALEHYRLALVRHPHSVAARLGAAQNLRRLSLPTEAEKMLADAPEKTAALLTMLGIVQDELEQHREAEQSHRAALALNPQDDSLHNNLGYNLMLQGRSAAAVEEFRAALALRPRSEVARGNLAQALAADNPTEALLHWESIAGPATAHNNLAAALIEQGKYAEARQELKAALTGGSPLPESMHNLKLGSELDGKPATFELSSKPGLWSRWGRSVRRWWVRQEDEPGRSAAAGRAGRRSSTRAVAVRQPDR